jgi:hypothetical protein
MNEHVVEVVTILGFAWIVVRVVGPFASALAKRLQGQPPIVAPPDPAIPELHAELEALQERLDFLERAIATQRHVNDRALPGQSRHVDADVHTPS